MPEIGKRFKNALKIDMGASVREGSSHGHLEISRISLGGTLKLDFGWVWESLGRLLGACWASLGHSWACLGRLLGMLSASWMFFWTFGLIFGQVWAGLGSQNCSFCLI